MALKRFIYVQLILVFTDLIILKAVAQPNVKLFYNFNEIIPELKSSFKPLKLPECYEDLLSINSIEAHYSHLKVNAPEKLLLFLVSKGIISMPTITNEVSREAYILSRYIYSTHYDSYLLMVVESYTDDLSLSGRYLYLVNIKKDTVISMFSLASYVSGEAFASQVYSIYDGNDIFVRRSDTIGSDVEFVEEEDKVKQKQKYQYRGKFILNSKTGKISKR